MFYFIELPELLTTFKAIGFSFVEEDVDLTLMLCYVSTHHVMCHGDLSKKSDRGKQRPRSPQNETQSQWSHD